MSKVTIRTFINKKKKGEKLVLVSTYDFPTAKLADEAGIHGIIVGDSAAMVVAGYSNTLPATMEMMVYHTMAVRRAVKKAMVIGDMPFMSYQASKEEALRNAGRFIKEAGADAVKLEGGEEVAELVAEMVRYGIPVMGHIGLTPQKINYFGGYRVQGRSEEEIEELVRSAKALEEAGAFSIVLECITLEGAKRITESVDIPTIGIGAGPHTDGQVLILHDLIGIFREMETRFVKRYCEAGELIFKALQDFKRETEEGTFPDRSHSYTLDEFKKT